VRAIKILALAFDAELIRKQSLSPSAKVSHEQRKGALSDFEEEAKLFEKLHGQEWVQQIVTMAINTGMRQGEIFDLTWFDVDLPRGVIHIRVSKNGKDRFVPINQTVRAMLEGLPHTSEYVFQVRRQRDALSMLSFVLIRRRATQESTISVSMTCVIQQPLGWLTAERTLSHLPRSSAGLTFEWLCATRTLPMRRSASS